MGPHEFYRYHHLHSIGTSFTLSDTFLGTTNYGLSRKKRVKIFSLKFSLSYLILLCCNSEAQCPLSVGGVELPGPVFTTWYSHSLFILVQA